MSCLDSSFGLFFCSTDQVGGQRNRIWRVRGQTRRIIMRLSGTMERYGECQMRMKPIIGEILKRRRGFGKLESGWWRSWLVWSIVAQPWLPLCAAGILKVKKELVLDIPVNFATILSMWSQVGWEPTQNPGLWNVVWTSELLSQRCRQFVTCHVKARH